MDTSIFKAYDVRGVVPTQLNEDAAARIAGGVIHVTGGKRVVVGQDVREHSRGLVEAMIEMLLAALQMRFQSEANCTHLEKEDDVAEGIARAFKRVSAAAHLASDIGKSAMIGFDLATRA